MRLWQLTLILLLKPALSPAADLGESCRALSGSDKAAAFACLKHAKVFEVAPELVAACAGFSPVLDFRMRCLKSGADITTYRICKSAGFTLDGTLTCLRSYPTADLLKSCQKASLSEEDQIQCLRVGN